VCRRAIHQQRFQRHEEVAGRVGDALVGLTSLAELGPQGRQNPGCMGDRCATEFEPLQFGQQIAARQWRQLLQIFLDAFFLHGGVDIARQVMGTGSEVGSFKKTKKGRRKKED